MSALNRIGLAAVVLMFTGLACKSSTAPISPVASRASKTFTSTTVQGHSHTMTIQRSEINTPPPGGFSRQTSESSGHSHTFTISEDQLIYLRVGWGSTVQIETTVDSGHCHTFTVGSW